MGKMKFDDLFLGKIDAYSEYLEYGPDTFRELFFEYPNFDINKILNGSVYYICGEKGTGKTMLLKYVESVINKKQEWYSIFIRFKTEIDEEERNKIKRASITKQQNYEERVKNEIIADTEIDCILAWQVYIIKLIIYRLEETNSGIFIRNSKTYESLRELIKSIYHSESTNNFNGILPKIKRGNIEINTGFFKLNSEFELEKDNNTNIVSFNAIGKKIVELYSSLELDNKDDNKLFILIDELELSLNKNKQYNRDITLIRDLILAIQRISEISKKNKFNVFLVSAIRNEVYKHVKSKGYEINKPITDFGIQISWQKKVEILKIILC